MTGKGGITLKIKIQIRYNYKTKHHSAVVGEENQNYDHVPLTHSPETSGRKNIKLKKNPNPEDKEDSYMVSRVRRHPKKTFTKEKENWKLDSEDEKKAYEIYDNKKKTSPSNS